MEIIVSNPTQAQPLPPIQWNYEEVKLWVENGLARYQGVVYDETQMAVAKKDRANLNKLVQAIDAKRKEMKAMYLKPYEEFETQAKELTAMVKKTSGEIDTQVKAFEDARRQEKRLEIEKLYAAMIGPLADLVPYSRLHETRWLNVSCSMGTVSEELGRKIDRITSGLKSIDTLNLAPDMEKTIKGVFLRNFDLAAALAERERIEKEQADLERFKAVQAAQREAENAATTKQTIEASDPKAFENLKPGDVVSFGGPGCVTAPEPQEPPIQLDFRVWVNKSQMNALREFLKSNGIKYGRVPTTNNR